MNDIAENMSPSKINFKNIPVQAGIISNIINIDILSHNCFRELDNLISSDQGVASLVLRVVNSALYSRGNKVATIPLAISLLGYSVVRSLALLAFSRSLFSHTKNAQFRLHIWQHSLLTAIASQSICQKLGYAKLNDEAFIAGLMHDTGKVLMFSHDPGLYEKVFKLVFDTSCTSSSAERRLFGFDHCQVGLEAVKEWKLPARFNNYMGEDITLPQPDMLADTVLLSLIAANYLVKTSGVGANQLDEHETRKVALLSFGLDEEMCEELLQGEFIESLMENEVYKLCASI
jgi:putative nucleotidyltransferase with HDIG domain